MHFVIKVLLGLFMIAAFTSCKLIGPKEGDVIDGYTLPPMPRKSENNKTLLGVDFNNNGIRDDLEHWIATASKYKNARNALRQMAYWEQKVLEAYPDIEKMKELRLFGTYYSQACLTNFGQFLGDGFDWVEPRREFWANFYNHPSRLNKMHELDRELTAKFGDPWGGDATQCNNPSHKQRDLELFCDFDIEDHERIQNKINNKYRRTNYTIKKGCKLKDAIWKRK